MWTLSLQKVLVRITCCISRVIGTKQAPSEDRTIPRVCVAPSLLGCLVGYAESESNFLNMSSTGTKEDDGYKGGWKIYAIPFKAALKPNARLVYDAKHSDEVWLVSYNEQNVEYKPESAGKMFYHAITFYPRSANTPIKEGTLYIEITKSEGIRFSPRFFLTKGYWCIEGPTAQHSSLAYSDKDFTVTEINKAKYQSAKDQAAALLGHEEPLPPYLKW